MSILIFSPFANFGNQSLCKSCPYHENFCYDSISIQLQSPVNATVSNLDDQLQGMSLIYIQDNKWSNTRQQCLDEIVSPKPSFYLNSCTKILYFKRTKQAIT